MRAWVCVCTCIGECFLYIVHVNVCECVCVRVCVHLYVCLSYGNSVCVPSENVV